LQLPALDLAEFDIAGDPGYSKQFFMFGPRDLYRPGETVILNALLRDSDGKPLADQPVKLEVVKPDGQVMRTVVSQPTNGLYHFTYPLDAARRPVHGRFAPIPAITNCAVVFPCRRLYARTHGAESEPQKTPLKADEDVDFNVAGYYLYGAPANGNPAGPALLRPLREAVKALPGFQFGDIAEENLTRSLDEVHLTLDEKGHGQVTAPASGRKRTRRCR
jgi:uncharacterized protein YfaS (alpha-2-macroglobulin family)